MGPIRIEILGLDTQNNIIYFARTDWVECDCDKYYIDSDSLEIITSWSGRLRLHRQEVLEEKGLNQLQKIDTSILKDPKTVC